MRLKEGITFDESKKMLITVWEKTEPSNVDMTLLGDENMINEIEKYWQGSGHTVSDFSVCWLFCYGNSGGNRYEKFETEIRALWKQLFDIPYNRFSDFQTSMDNGEIIKDCFNRYLHKRREKFRDKMEDFTFIDRSIHDFLLMLMLYGKE